MRRRDFVLVNPAWGMWSLSTRELLERQELVQRVQSWAMALGITQFSVRTIGDLTRHLQRGHFGSVLALLLLGSVAMANSLEGRKINAELVRRLKNQGEM